VIGLIMINPLPPGREQHAISRKVATSTVERQLLGVRHADQPAARTWAGETYIRW
jgi:hypothetical protein